MEHKGIVYTGIIIICLMTIGLIPFVMHSAVNEVVFEVTRFTNCPCSNPVWCEPIKVTPKREVFAFSTVNSDEHWMLYDWSKLTTIVMFGYINQTLMCLAHAQGVRVVMLASVGPKTFLDPTMRNTWIHERLKDVQQNYLDGINFDFESPISINDRTTRNAYTDLVAATNDLFKRLLPFSQISVDVAWKPNIDGRYYDYRGLAESADLLFVMAYDEQSQIFGECVAGPNSDIHRAEEGLDVFSNDPSLRIKPEKLVLGVPWYGYRYPCTSLEGDKCHIKKVPFRGVNCSDAAGREVGYGDVYKLIQTLPSLVKWNGTSSTPYFTYGDSVNQFIQIQYDNPTSLALKYDLAEKKGLRGVGMWNIDSLDYSDSEMGRTIRLEMFGSLPSRESSSLRFVSEKEKN